MNATKKNLIMSAGLLNIITAFMSAIMILFVAFYFNTLQDFFIANFSIEFTFDQVKQLKLILIGVFSAISFILLIAGLLLVYSVRTKGYFFRKSKSYFWTGAIMTFIVGFVTIPSILIYVALGSDESKDTEEHASSVEHTVYNERRNEEFKAKIQKIRALRDSEEITEEEFKKMLEDLL